MGKANLVRKIRRSVTWFLRYLFRKLGISDTTTNQDLKVIRALGPANYKSTIRLLSKSRSQFRQDLFVISETQHKIQNNKKGGYFVEFGATNGIDLSNTYLLETELSWTGILAEPARLWEKQLKANRPNASVETLCVWKDSNSKLIFHETDIPELSTIDSFSDGDVHGNIRLAGKKYEVHTISLNDLLIKHKAPKYIDYLSIDTEGSEYEILKAFNFNEFSFGIITVEHNYTPQREMIFALLTSHGYKRKYEDISACDDWYVKS
jgi:FkbM family methyltransferase